MKNIMLKAGELETLLSFKDKNKNCVITFKLKTMIEDYRDLESIPEPEHRNDFTADVWRSAFDKGKKKLPKGKYKYVYSYELPSGRIVHQSYISKYNWSKYHDSEKEAAKAVDMYLISKGEEPVNVLVRK